MRLRALIALNLLAAMSPGMAAGGSADRFTAADLFSLEAATDPQISPNGQWIAYVRYSNDIMIDRARPAVWLTEVTTRRQIPLIDMPGEYFMPRWSPDGSRLAYLSVTDGSSHLYVQKMATGATTLIADLTQGLDSVAWAPDGNRIAFIMKVLDDEKTLGHASEKPAGASWAEPPTMTDSINYRADGRGYLAPGANQIFVVSADGGAVHQVTFGEWDVKGPLSWSSDGRMILFASDRREDAVLRPADSEIYSVEVASGALAALTHRTGPDFNVQVSPDGSKIAYLGHDDTGHNYDNNQLYVMSRDGSASRSLTAALDRSIDAVHWESSGALWASYLDHGVQRVIRITLSGQVKTVASGLVGAGLELPMMSGATFSVSRRGLIAYAGGDSLHPPDIYIAGYRSGFRRLTRLNDALLAGKTLAPVRHAPVTASDGRTIDTWLATPPGYVTNTKVPLILEIHGGPYAAYGPAFSTAQQLYAAAGYAVLYANPRGSISYGAEFANLIEETFPDGVHGDLMAAVDAAIAQGIADPDDLFVTGASAGGSLTAWIIGKTHRFKAAATQMPVINWLSWRLTTDRPAQYFPGWLASKPWEDPQGYWARSPLSLVGNVTTPTLVICGTEDFITRISESEQYYTALKLQRVPTAFIRVPGVGHGDIAARPTQSAAKAAAITAWFDRYRRPIQ